MATRNFVLGSAAGFVLAGAMLTAAPVFAQYDNSRDSQSSQYSRDSQSEYPRDTRGGYPRQSTPAERAQTQDLNRGGVRTAPPSAEDQSTYETAQSRYDAARSDYEQRLRDYNERTRAYQDQLRGYNRTFDDRDEGRDIGPDDRDVGPDRGAYNVSPEGPDVTVTASSGPGSDAFDQLWDLRRVGNPNRELFNVQVRDIDGFSVGRFRRLETRDNGDVMAVITLDTMRTISVPMDDVRFDPDRSIVVADLTARELISTPSDTPLGRAF